MKLVDTHAHIYDKQFKPDFEEVIDRISKELEFIVSIGYDLETSEKSVELAEKYPFIYGVVGVHPTEIKKYNDIVEKKLEELAKNSKVTAIGEIGLDYHWMEDPKEKQEEIFRKQLELAKRVKLPVVIHTREAMEDTVKILEDYKEIGGIMHCYPGSYETAKKLIDRYYFGIGGVVTFKNNKVTKETVEKLPIERIVIETDCPYLTPVPFRGKRNEPVYVKYIAEEIARIKGISLEEVIKITTKNAKEIYGISV